MKGWWEQLVGGAIFSQPGNRKNSKLEPNQSRRMLQAFKPALKENFYDKVFMYLGVELGSIDLRQNFSCSWTQMVAAFTRALGEECKAKCIDSFIVESANIVGGESVENTLYKVNTLVDKTFDSLDKIYIDQHGVSQDNRQIKKWIKYSLSFRISQQLPQSCIELRPFLRKHTADLLFTPKQDFIDFIDAARVEAARLMKDEEFRSAKIHSATKKTYQQITPKYQKKT